RYGNNSVILKWDPYLPKNADGFELWRRDVINGVEIPFRKIKNLPVSYLSYTDGNLSQYQEYSYYLKAYNESGSSASNIVSTSSLPDGPWNLQAEAIGASSVHLKWVDFALNETAFQIERTNPTTNEFKILKITEGPNITEYYDNSVSASTAYSYRVAYFTQSTMSSYSNIVTLTTFHADVSAPSELTSTFVAEGLQLSWKDNSQSLSKGTIIERQTGTNDFVEIGNVSSDKTSFIDRSPVSGVTYYRVRQILGTKTYTPYSNILRVIF
ncbi:MAG: fibronectin type III domain-containing protein, partial [Melioribacteraceae bacterium]